MVIIVKTRDALKNKPPQKPLHPRNPHHGQYDFNALVKIEPSLKPFVAVNKYGNLSIDFSNPKAVIALNKALLKQFYKIEFWEIPQGYLCPPIPGRADYVHYLADLLARTNADVIPKGNQIRGLDIGIGANGIYALIANKSYQWSFVGSDIDKTSLESVSKIIDKNSLSTVIEVVHQKNPEDIFTNIVDQTSYFDFTLCNPPFHKSKKEAQQGTKRKVQNLTKQKQKNPTLNFGGQSNELWCKGGELSFIKRMIIQSKTFEKNCLWFTSLVSKKENLKAIEQTLKASKVFEFHIIEMKQGQKTSRFIAWTFLNKEEQKKWAQKRWQ